jgi:organic radical activating enzyme
MKELVRIETMEASNRLRIEYMIGNYCNYNCLYCGPYANGGDFRWPKDYESLMKNFTHLLDFYVANGRNKFEVNLLGGEPSLWPSVAQFARDLKKLYDLKVTMTTNGSRTLRWWDKNAEAFDKILFSFHQKEADINHYIKVLDNVYDKGIPLNALIMMDPTVWNECVASIEIMKKSSKNSWFICAMEVHPPQYTSEQRTFFKNHVKRKPPIWRILKDEWENIVKGKTKALYNDGSREKVERNFFSVNNLNNFEGWICNIGIENINIQKDGKISGVCNNFLYGEQQFYNLYDSDFIKKFNPKLVPTLCTKNKCWCQPEMLMTKWKI